MILVVSTSLNPESCSRVLARHALDQLKTTGQQADWLDLQDLELPFCNASSCYNHPNVGKAAKQIAEAKCVLMACPIYNFDVGAAAKNLVELTGRNSWSEKVVGFLLSAGGQGSYMSVMPFANSLMLDFRCLIIPRFVYTTSEGVSGENLVGDGLAERIDELNQRAIQLIR